MDRQERAVKLHGEGFNCAQSVLLSNDDHTGLDNSVAKKISCGFGGGVRSGEVCGCISGGVMALGMCSEQTETADLAKELVAAFREAFGFVRCAELKQKYGGNTKCNDMIAFAADLTDRIIAEHGKAHTEA